MSLATDGVPDEGLVELQGQLSSGLAKLVDDMGKPEISFDRAVTSTFGPLMPHARTSRSQGTWLQQT